MKGGGRDRVGVPARAVFSGESTAATRSPDLEGNKKREATKPEIVLFMAMIVMSVSQVKVTIIYYYN